mmetsp:Transcript_2393/g.7260  ORF Transcript_2393/g.7260 Transcript_2393/m.7260 type:complete len:123 (-) Transcript_2393:58-426(-)
MASIGASVSGALNDPESDPVALLEAAKKECFKFEQRAEQECDAKEKALARVEELAQELQALLATQATLESEAARAVLLKKALGDIAGAAGADAGLFSFLQQPKSDAEQVKEILAKIAQLKKR